MADRARQLFRPLRRRKASAALHWPGSASRAGAGDTSSAPAGFKARPDNRQRQQADQPYSHYRFSFVFAAFTPEAAGCEVPPASGSRAGVRATIGRRLAAPAAESSEFAGGAARANTCDNPSPAASRDDISDIAPGAAQEAARHIVFLADSAELGAARVADAPHDLDVLFVRPGRSDRHLALDREIRLAAGFDDRQVLLAQHARDGAGERGLASPGAPVTRRTPPGAARFPACSLGLLRLRLPVAPRGAIADVGGFLPRLGGPGRRRVPPRRSRLGCVRLPRGRQSARRGRRGAGSAGCLTSSGATALALSAASRSTIAAAGRLPLRRPSPRSRPRARRFCGLSHPRGAIHAATADLPSRGGLRQAAIELIAAEAVVFSLAGISRRAARGRSRRRAWPRSRSARPRSARSTRRRFRGTASSSAGGRSSANGCGNGWQAASSAASARRRQQRRAAGASAGAARLSQHRAGREQAEQTEDTEHDQIRHRAVRPRARSPRDRGRNPLRRAGRRADS